MATGDVESEHPQTPTADPNPPPSQPGALSPADLMPADEDDDATTTEYRRTDFSDDCVTQVNIDRPLPSPPPVPDFAPPKR